jgi:hypothetical protein
MRTCSAIVDAKKTESRSKASGGRLLAVKRREAFARGGRFAPPSNRRVPIAEHLAEVVLQMVNVVHE